MHKIQYTPTITSPNPHSHFHPHPHSIPAPQQKSSQLIQQLCKHITKLQQLNTKLHEQIQKYQMDKQLVCIGFGISNWDQVVRDFRDKYQKEKNRNIKKERVIGGEEEGKDVGELLDTNVSQNGVKNMRTPNRKQQSRQSLYQSPIQSQSRLINRSIHGETVRQPEPLPFTIPPPSQNLFTLRSPLSQLNAHNFPFHPAVGLDNHAAQTHSYYNSTSNSIKKHIQKIENMENVNNYDVENKMRDFRKEKIDMANVEEDNMILSIENTRLRQRIAKLEAIIGLQKYH